MDRVVIQIIFDEEVEVKGIKTIYRDALYMSEDEYAALTPEDLIQKKQERIQRYIDTVNAPQEESEVPLG